MGSFRVMTWPKYTPERKGFAILIYVAAAIAILLTYKSWKGAETRTAVALQRLGRVPDFSLTDQDGHPFGSGDLKGKLWVADFICTRCAGPGPMMSSHFAELDRNFGRGNSLKLITFTVDPKYDTPGVLKRYAQQYEASTRWSFVAGDKNQIDNFAKIGSRTPVQMPSSQSNPVQTTTFILVDGDGVIRSYYDGSSAEVVQRLLTDIGSLLRETGK
jgi:protein SCO1/2